MLNDGLLVSDHYPDPIEGATWQTSVDPHRTRLHALVGVSELTLFVRAKRIGQGSTTFMTFANTSGNWQYVHHASGRIDSRFPFTGGQSTVIGLQSGIEIGQTFTFCNRVKSGILSQWVDGVFDGDNAISGNAGSSFGTCLLGRSGRGLALDFLAWSRALSDAEIAECHNYLTANDRFAINGGTTATAPRFESPYIWR